MDAWLLAQYSKIEAIKAEIQGMVALNQYRINRDETIAYDDNAFQEKADVLHNISGGIVLFLEREENEFMDRVRQRIRKDERSTYRQAYQKTRT